MKRLYTYIFITVAVTLACLSCAKEESALNTNGEALTELLEVPEEAVVVDSSKGTQSVTILSRYAFKAEEDADWLVCSELDHRTLQLNFDENRTTNEREATIVITITDEYFGVSYSKVFKVKQTRGKATVDAYLIDGGWGETQHVTEYLVESFEEDLTMYVKSNAEYSVSSDCDWITWSKSTNLSNEERDAWSLIIAQNNAVKGENRVGHIYVTAEDATSVITIKQSPFLPSIVISTQSKEFNLSPAATTSKIIFYTNSSWKASCDADWITLLDSEEIFNNQAANTYCKLSFSVSANEGASMRSAIITIESADSSYGEKQTITINQSPFLPSIVISTQSKEFNLSPVATTSKIIFYTNSSWKASCDADWITLLNNEEIFNNQAANKDCELSFSVSANEGVSMRSAIITIESADSSYGEKQTVIVNQDGAFMVSDVRLQYMEGYHNVDFNVSVDWVVTCDATWLTLPTSGTSNDNIIVISVEENNSNEIREAVVHISAANDSTMYTSFTVTQDHINTIYYHSNSNCSFYINQLTFGGAEIVEHIFDANSGIGRVVFDGEVISVERNEEMAAYPSWGYGTSTVTLPPTIKTIGLHTFYDCPALTRIDLPKSVTSIAEEAIMSCGQVVEIYCEATNPPAGATGMFKLNEDCKIYVPMDSVDAYKNAVYWSEYAERIVGF